MTGNSDLSEAAQGMNLEQRGAFYASALTAATEAGVDTTQQFMQQYGNEYKETMQSIAQSHYGLSQNQAAVFGQSFSTDKGQMDQAVNNLKMEYAEQNPDGSPMIENGVPVLSQQNEEFTNQMVNVLQNASNAGDRAGSYLTPIRGYNITERGLDSKH
jgi:conjugal transfer mating pair stabilization protein TraG